MAKQKIPNGSKGNRRPYTKPRVTKHGVLTQTALAHSY